MRESLIVLVLQCCCVVATARASDLVANFDSFSEGPIFTDFTDGGLRFSELDVALEGDINPFVIDDASFHPWTYQTLPNLLTFTGYAPGPSHGFGRFRSMTITFPETANRATLDAYTSSNGNTNKAFVVSAFLNDIAVATNTFLLPQGTTIEANVLHHAISIEAPSFNKLTLLTTFRGTPDFVTLAIDNVKVQPVPEPGVPVSLIVGTVALVAPRRRR
jgi:hypothetical protein